MPGALPSVTATGGLQLHPRVPNGLGSAPAGAAIPAAALSAIAAANNTFLITNRSFVRVVSTVYERRQDPACRGQNAAMLTPTKNPA
jgi:hypothetical protein